MKGPVRISRRYLLGSTIPLFAGAGCDLSSDRGANMTAAQSALGKAGFATFEDFGAVGDASVDGSGTDDTAAIQAAIDWAFDAGKANPPRAILMTAKNFLCGNIRVHPTTTIVGTGRHTSNFICKSGTRGKWWADRGSAQKIMLSGIAWYGRGQASLSHIMQLGTGGIPLGTESILQGLWLRDAPEGHALEVNGNVAILRDITLQACKYAIKAFGNANHAENIFCMEAGEDAAAPAEAIGAEIFGWFIRGLHLEATANGALPLKMRGNCHVEDLVIATARGYTHDHLIEVDTAEDQEWSLQTVQLLGSDYTIQKAILKIGYEYRDDIAPDLFSGASYLRSLDIHSGRLSLRGQLWQAFALEVRNDGGGLKHRVGSLSDPAAQTSFSSRVRGASSAFSSLTGSPRFAGGARLDDRDRSQLILDTAPQIPASAALQCIIQYNSSGTALTSWARLVPSETGRGAQTRLVVQFFDAASGAPYDLSSLRRGGAIVVGLTGFIG